MVRKIARVILHTIIIPEIPPFFEWIGNTQAYKAYACNRQSEPTKLYLVEISILLSEY